MNARGKSKPTPSLPAIETKRHGGFSSPRCQIRVTSSRGFAHQRAGSRSKAQAQKLKATLKVGKEGLSAQFLAALDDTLKHHELVKVKFDQFKEQKKELAPQLAEKSRSHLVTRIGNVVVLYRPKLTEEKLVQ